jgi:hypothetical protein
MNPCAAKRGIFTLRDCELPAITDCSDCGKPLCGEHAVWIEQVAYCNPCSMNRGQNTGDSDSNDWESTGWSGRWRDNYHRQQNYHAIYYGDAGDAAFSDEDHAAFDDRPEAALAGDDEATGFSDS